jgi:lysophospholipase L1-like esterase
MYSREPILTSDTVFLGDSLTEGFDLKKYFSDKQLKNRGISGDTTMQVIFRIDEIVNVKPEHVFLMIGINDLFHGSSAEQVTTEISKIIDLIDRPGHLSVLSILPVNETFLVMEFNLNTKIYRANDLIRSICKDKGVKYIDLHGDFLDNNGQMDRRYTYDGAHLTDAGYDLWAALIEPYLP